MTLQQPTDAPRGTYTPSQAAQLLGVHVNTVRSWCNEYADVLSDGARSRPRLLSPSDVAVLQLVQQLRAENLPRSEVLQRLRQTPTADLQQPWLDAAPAVAVQPTDSPTETPTAPLVPLDVSAVLVDIAALVDRRTTGTQEAIQRLDERTDARLRTLEAQRSVWLGVAVGLLAGLALGVIAAAVLLRG
jgi:DNA-binding transcriptional MerR regulator